jgi:biopolymer transport protein ExbD
MKKRFARKRSNEQIDVDITSLLDILTILLVFLLMSYNASDLTLDLTKNLEMADSNAQELTKFAPVLQVNKNAVVFLNNKEIGRLPASGSMPELTSALKRQRSSERRSLMLPSLIHNLKASFESISIGGN